MWFVAKLISENFGSITVPSPLPLPPTTNPGYAAAWNVLFMFTSKWTKMRLATGLHPDPRSLNPPLWNPLHVTAKHAVLLLPLLHCTLLHRIMCLTLFHVHYGFWFSRQPLCKILSVHVCSSLPEWFCVVQLHACVARACTVFVRYYTTSVGSDDDGGTVKHYGVAQKSKLYTLVDISTNNVIRVLFL